MAMYGLTHGARGKPAHEFRRHGFSSRYSSLDASDARIQGAEKYVYAKAEDRKELGQQPAGYDLNSMAGGDDKFLDSSLYGVGGRGFRDTSPLNTHQGIEMKGSDYRHRNRGFRYRAFLGGV